MAWLARLDARAAKWPRPLRWPYVTLKWFLAAMGLYMLIGMAFQERAEGRLGIGLGFVTMIILATVKGVLMAMSGHRDDPP
jgi:hypothetical protein